jgi:uncharacterized membrane protein YdjX (TVP38/TMEM64 family)
MKPSAPFRAALAVGLSIVLIGSTVVLYVPAYRSAFNARLGEFLEAVHQLGGWGPAIVGAAYVPACLLFIPGSALTLFGGFAFGGTFRGLVVVTACLSVGSTLGASAAFLVGRTAARQWIEKKMAGNLRFRAIDAAVGSQGFKVVLLTRLSPVFPFNLLNYAFGLTRVSFRDYVLGSWIGMLPGTIMYVYLGSTAGQLADVVAGTAAKSPAQQVLFYTGLAATVVVTIFITRVSRRALAAVAPGPVESEPMGNDA